MPRLSGPDAVKMSGGGFSRLAKPAEADPTQLRDNGTASTAGKPDIDTFTLGNFAIDEYRPVKVIVIGAGFSGILAGIRYVSS